MRKNCSLYEYKWIISHTDFPMNAKLSTLDCFALAISTAFS